MISKKILLSLLVLGIGCANIYTARGVYHRLQRGETLSLLSRQYGVPLQELAEINNIEKEGEIRPGDSLFIPGVKAGRFHPKRRGRVALRRGSGEGRSSREGRAQSDKIQVDHGRFSWPVRGELSSAYGVRNGRRHDGIDIRAERGTPVHAAADGEVVYSRRLSGYGNLVLLKHPGNFFTVYAHNAVNLVKKGVGIKKGEVVARVGSTGRASGPHLHFEVREGSRPRNPLFFLPRSP